MPKTALLSVYHKDGIVEFAQELVKLGWNIIASGGTAKALKDGGVPVRNIGEIVGEPILGHRVVTLSRQIHAGLLARAVPEDEAELARLGLPRINLICFDLYPLSEAIAKPDATRESVIEMTDVGGPTALHSGAKGERIVICDPADRMRVVEFLKTHQDLDSGSRAGMTPPPPTSLSTEVEVQKFIDQLAAKAEAYVANYLLTSARYRGKYAQGGDLVEPYDGFIGELVQQCKYGENAWQAPAALYRALTNADLTRTSADSDPLALSNFKLAAGDALSYNNLCDVDRMLQNVTHIAAAFDTNFNTVPFIAVGVKHGNACGAAVGADPIDVIKNMVSGDTRAIFGGLVLTNFPINMVVAQALREAHMPEGQKRLLDGIVAPSFTPDTIEYLSRKGGKCRLLQNPALATLAAKSLNTEPRFRAVRGGFLKQPNYAFVLNLKDQKVEWSGMVNPLSLPLSAANSDGRGRSIAADLLLAWAVGATSNSNTVTLIKDGQLIGNGVGQQDRVGCCELAIKRATDAGHSVEGAVAYSDSFFPFPDGPEVLAKAGIKAIFATSGSVKDGEVKAMCEKHGVVMVMAPDAMARGFYNH